MTRILSNEDGIIETFHKDAMSGAITVNRTQNVEDYFSNNKLKANQQQAGWKGDLHEVADIPLVIWEQWWKEFGSNPGSKENRKRLIAKLNSSDFSKLRSKRGNI